MHCDFPKPTCTNIIVCIQVVVIWLCMYEAMHLVYDENHQIASMNQLCWGAVYRWTCSIRTHVCVSVYVYIYIYRYHFHINKQTTVFIDIFTYHIYRYTDILYVFIYEYYIYTCFLDTRGTYVLDLWRRHTHTHNLTSKVDPDMFPSHGSGRHGIATHLYLWWEAWNNAQEYCISREKDPKLNLLFLGSPCRFYIFFGKIILHLTAPRYEWNFQDRAAKKSFVFPNSYGKAPAALNLVVRQLYSHGSAYNTET